MSGGWGVCMEGVGWRAPAGVSVFTGAGVALALLTRATPATHLLRQERPQHLLTLHQIQLDKVRSLFHDRYYRTRTIIILKQFISIKIWIWP